MDLPLQWHKSNPTLTCLKAFNGFPRYLKQGPHSGPARLTNLNLPLLSSHLPGPSHTGFLEVFKHVRLFPALGPYTRFSFSPGPFPISEWLTLPHPSDLSSNISCAGRPFLIILSKLTPGHSYDSLTHQPVSLLHSTYHTLKLSCLFICPLVYYQYSPSKYKTKTGAGCIWLYQLAYTMYSNILNEWELGKYSDSRSAGAELRWKTSVFPIWSWELLYNFFFLLHWGVSK